MEIDFGLDRDLSLAEAHDRSLAEGPLDLPESGVQCLGLIHAFSLDNLERRLSHVSSPLFHMGRVQCNDANVRVSFQNGKPKSDQK